MVTGNRFSVALSFAGAHRSDIEPVAQLLAQRFGGKEKVLYDFFHRAEFSRVDLAFYLPDLYSQQSDLVVVFLGSQYLDREWCSLEWRSIFSMIKEKAQKDKIMFFRYDYVEIPGLYGLEGSISMDGLQPEEMADLIMERHQLETSSSSPASPPATVVASSASAPTTPASPTAPIFTALQTQCLQALEKVWDDPFFVRFAKAIAPSPHPSARSLVSDVVMQQSTYDVLNLTAWLNRVVENAKKLPNANELPISDEVRQALTLLGIVSHERYLAANGATGTETVNAPNLLFAALAASAGRGIDVIAHPEDVDLRTVTNRPLQPGFQALSSDDGTTQLWIDIKVNLLASAHAVCDCTANLNAAAIHQAYYGKRDRISQEPTDEEVIKDLKIAANHLGGKFVYYLDPEETPPAFLALLGEIQAKFDVHYVMWERADIAFQIAHQTLDNYLKRVSTITKDENDQVPVTPTPNSKKSSLLDKLPAGLAGAERISGHVAGTLNNVEKVTGPKFWSGIYDFLIKHWSQ